MQQQKPSSRGGQGCREREKKKIWSPASKDLATNSAAFWEVTSNLMLLIFAPPHHSHQIIRLFPIQSRSLFPPLLSGPTPLSAWLQQPPPLVHPFFAVSSIPPSVGLLFAVFFFLPRHLPGTSATRFPSFFSLTSLLFALPLSLSLSLPSSSSFLLLPPSPSYFFFFLLLTSLVALPFFVYHHINISSALLPTMSRPTTRMNEYFVPRDGIDREVISADICRYLGNDALVRPGHYEVCPRMPALQQQQQQQHRQPKLGYPRVVDATTALKHLC